MDESLALLRTDWVDLWYVHDVRTQADLDTISGPGGALETFAQARQRGEVRFIGVSAHENPGVLSAALELFEFDCVLLPVNPAEAFTDAFATTVIPQARAKRMGVVAMKTLCRGLVARLPGYPGAGDFLRYALGTEGVHVVSVGCDDPAQLEENVAALAAGRELAPDRREALEGFLYPHHRELRYYRPG